MVSFIKHTQIINCLNAWKNIYNHSGFLFLCDSQIQNRKDEFCYNTSFITKVDELGSDLNQGRENMDLSLFRGKDSIEV